MKEMIIFKTENIKKKSNKKLGFECYAVVKTWWIIGFPIYTSENTKTWKKIEIPVNPPLQ